VYSGPLQSSNKASRSLSLPKVLQNVFNVASTDQDVGGQFRRRLGYALAVKCSLTIGPTDSRDKEVMIPFSPSTTRHWELLTSSPYSQMDSPQQSRNRIPLTLFNDLNLSPLLQNLRNEHPLQFNPKKRKNFSGDVLNQNVQRILSNNKKHKETIPWQVRGEERTK